MSVCSDVLEPLIKPFVSAVVGAFRKRPEPSGDHDHGREHHPSPEIQITSPRTPREVLQDKRRYGEVFSYRVEGKLEYLSEGHEIWLLNVNDRAQQVWPQGFSPVKDWDAQTGVWTGRVCGKPGETIKIVAVVAPPSSADFFNYYQDICDGGVVKPLRRIPPECTNQASISVTLP
jgi:hypothetical protein